MASQGHTSEGPYHELLQQERAMLELGVASYRSRVDRAKRAGRESHTPPVRHLMRRSVRLLAKAVQDWALEAQTKPGRLHGAYRPLSRFLAGEGRKDRTGQVALISCRVVLDQVSAVRRERSVALELGNALELEDLLSACEAQQGSLYHRLRRQSRAMGRSRQAKYILARFQIGRESTAKRGPRFRPHKQKRRFKPADYVKKPLPVLWDPLELKERLALGEVLLQLVVQETGLVERVSRKPLGSRGKAKHFLRPSPEAELWLQESHAYHQGQRPVHLPLCCPPLDWTDAHSGAYRSQDLALPLLKTRSRRSLELAGPETCPKVYQAVNALQRVPWRLNEEVLLVLEHFWSLGRELAGLPPRGKDGQVSQRGLGLLVSQTLWTARRYQDSGPFWFAYTLDWRGRAYPLPPYLNPQGHDIARGLLTFANAKPLSPDGAAWLAIAGASHWGLPASPGEPALDKASLERRVQWVQEHESEIRSVHQDPISDTWWAQADKPWQFLAFCLEWGAYCWACEQGEEFHSSLPVPQDGTCNGLQIFALLMRDREGGEATNCTPASWQDTPRDIYSDVAQRATRELKRLAASGDHDASVWLAILGPAGIPRKAVKRQVMTLPYGLTEYSADAYLADWWDETYGDRSRAEHRETVVGRGYGESRFQRGTWQATKQLSAIVWDAIRELTSGAQQCMDWLRKCADVCNRHDVAPIWSVPTGLRVRQANLSWNNQTLQTAAGESIKLSSGEPGRLDTRAQVRGLAPNYVHSLDAAAMMLTTLACAERGVSDLSMVHDSYATLAEDSAVLASTLREVFSGIFQEHLLQRLRDDLLANLPAGAELPQPPLLNTGLDPRELAEARYFFS